MFKIEIDPESWLWLPKTFFETLYIFYINIHPSHKIIQFANAYIINRLKNAHNQICGINNSI